MPAKRIEFTVSEELWDQIERARGDVSRARWIKRALESALGEGPPEGTPGKLVAERQGRGQPKSAAEPGRLVTSPAKPASSRAPVEKEPPGRPDGEGEAAPSARHKSAVPSRPARTPAQVRQAALNKAKGL
jgi:hypothetical protein